MHGGRDKKKERKVGRERREEGRGSMEGERKEEEEKKSKERLDRLLNRIKYPAHD